MMTWDSNAFDKGRIEQKNWPGINLSYPKLTTRKREIEQSVGNDASLRGTGDLTSLHPRLLDVCAALLYYIHGPETP